jgi:hypothetical protein
MTQPISAYADALDDLIKVHQQQLFAWERKDVEAFRLAVLQRRFETLREHVGALRKLASLQKTAAIETLDDAVPVLFQHTVYKSYPMSFLEQGRFDALTKWLDQLTVHDLSKVNARDCRSVTEWFRLLEAETPVRPIHTTGTSGKLSVIPRTEADSYRMLWTTGNKWQGYGDEPDNTLDIDALQRDPIATIHPGYRHGFYSGLRLLDAQLKTISRDDLCVSLYDDWLDPDVLSLAGRVMSAEAKGQLDSLKIDPALLQRYRQNQERIKNKPQADAEFFDRALERFGGQRVLFAGGTMMMLQWAQEGARRGMKGLFAANSWTAIGGGTKGAALPENWLATIEEVIGAPMASSYAMSELTAAMPACRHGNFHVPPYLVPYVLDEATGEALPRTGTQVGRAAFFDLLPETFWGGFITGDEITLHWDGDCPCGRSGEYIEPTIRRFSEKNGGQDDKISCAGAADAQDKAMEYLARIAGEN